MWEDLVSFFVQATNWVLEKLVEFLAFVIEAFLSFIPDTETIDASSAVSGWPSDVLYFLYIFEFDYALSVMFTALIARFMLKRIPFIG